MSITPENLKLHMRLDADDTSEDVLLADKIAAAEAWVASYIGSPLSDATAPVPAPVPAPVLEAVRRLAAHLYENREATTFGDVDTLPFGVMALLSPYRSWTF